MADAELKRKLRNSATKHGLYIPAGALWGGQDIAKMAEAGNLKVNSSCCTI